MADVGSINKVILLGYLGKDPELQKDLNAKRPFCTISVATKEYFNPGPDGKKKPPHTTWHQCVVWGRRAEIIAKYGKAGTLVAVEGKLKRKRWETKDGEKRVNTQVVVDELTIVGGKIKTQPIEEPQDEYIEQDEFNLGEE